MGEQEQNEEYINQLATEKESLDGSFPHATRFLQEEIDRVQSGRSKDASKPLTVIHNDKPVKVSEKILIPVKEFPKCNFVGKLLGPGGNTLKRLQQETGTKMSILGKGSMKDKKKEEEFRKEGGKYSHLNDELHVLVECYSLCADAHARLSHGIGEVRKFLTPEVNEDIRQQQMQEMMFLNGGEAGRGGRGRGRGGPPGASPRGRGAPLPLMGGGRGGAAPRGAPPTRGGGFTRGAPAPRGARGGTMARPPPQQAMQEAAYDEYSGGYEESAYETGLEGGYEQQSYPAADEGQFYEYGNAASTGYDDSYSGSATTTGYGDGWGAQSASSYGKAAPAKKPDARSHPYGGGMSTGGGGGGMGRGGGGSRY